MPDQHPTQALLHLLRRKDPHDPIKTPPALEADIWPHILHQARRHTVASLLYRQLKNSPLEQPAEAALEPLAKPPVERSAAAPFEIMAALQRASYATAAHNLLIYHQLAKILERFAQQGLPVIALKGLHLSELVYQDISLRPMGDMDLLVPYEKLQPSYNLLRQMGYQSTPFAQLEKDARRHHHLPALSKPGSAIIELHWSLAAPNQDQPIDLAALWQRAQPVQLADSPARVLSPEDLLLHLALHFNNHNFRLELRHLYDLLATLEHYQDQIDWTILLTRSQAWRAQRCLFLALYLAHNLLNAPLPGDFLAQLTPPGFTDAMAEQARQRLLNPQSKELHPDLVQLWSRRPAAHKINAAWRALFPPLEYMRHKYQTPPQALRIYPYYLLRLAQLLRQYGRQAWQLLRRNPQLTAAAQNENNLTNWLHADNA